MCSNQVLDSQTLTSMKNDLARSYYLLTGKLEQAKSQLQNEISLISRNIEKLKIMTYD